MPDLISVITPVYNGRGFIRRCFANLKLQTFTDWEWVVVDDGSTDGLEREFEKIHDPRVRLIAYRPNRGRGYARKKAVESARGDWVAIWDMDDLSFPDRLEKIHLAKKNGWDFICSPVVIIDEGIRIKGMRGFSPSMIDGAPIFPHTSLACRRAIALEIGYHPEYRAGEDAAMIFRLSRHFKGCWEDEPLTAYFEEREVSLGKAILSNRNQYRTAVSMIKNGFLPLNTAGRMALHTKWTLKLLLLNLMRPCPGLYRKTIALRSKGHLHRMDQIPNRHVEFLDRIRLDPRFGVMEDKQTTDRGHA